MKTTEARIQQAINEIIAAIRKQCPSDDPRGCLMAGDQAGSMIWNKFRSMNPDTSPSQIICQVQRGLMN